MFSEKVVGGVKIINDKEDFFLFRQNFELLK